MNLAASLPPSMPSIDTIKMEDRKRPALDDDGRSLPPFKRQAISVNGTNTHPDADMPWKEDVEVSRNQLNTLKRCLNAYSIVLNFH